MFLVFKQSKKVYKVVGQSEDGTVKVERVGDGKGFVVDVSTIQHKYRPITPEEMVVLQANLSRYLRAGTIVTTDMLTTPVRSPAEQAEGTQQVEQEEEIRIGTMVKPDERHDFDRILLHPEVRKSIEIGLTKIKEAAFLNDTWNLKSVEPMGNRTALNFYGPPGTGKTLSAIAIARQLGKPMLQVDYSQLISKYVGDTGKHIAECFSIAKAKGAVLFFDEADSMLSKRTSGDASTESPSINQNRNILMQELDKFDGVVIFTTNLFSNYDDALLRRIAQHVQFELPTEEMRVALLNAHIPVEVPLASDVDTGQLAKQCKDFSGGDIKNVCINAIVAAAMEPVPPAERKLTNAHLQSEMKKVREAKKEHAGKTGKVAKRKPMGIHTTMDMETE